jgi:hypothetical protein
MAFSEETIREIVLKAERDGAPASIAIDLEADLLNALFAHRRRMDRINRHTQVLDMVSRCKGNVSAAAEVIGITPRAVYHHLEKVKRVPFTASHQIEKVCINE